MKNFYAVEVETINTEDATAGYDDSSVGMTNGYMRYITSRPDYTGTDTGAATIPIGDNSVIKLTITGNTETIGTAFQSGELYTPSNGIFKSANTVLNVGDRFTVQGVGDFIGDELETEKGSTPAEGDMFEVVNNESGTEEVKYVGVNKWFEDFVSKNGMSNPSRRVDQTGTGDYGTLSGFSFKIDISIVAGTTTPYWKTLTTNEVHLHNKTIRLYAVIDNVFYQIWSGIVDNNPQSDIDYRFVCKSNYKAVHKDLPPNVFNNKDYPNTVDDVKDKSVPVCIGDIEYTKIFNVSGFPAYQVLNTFGNVNYELAQATSYTQSSTSAVVTLRTEIPDNTYVADDLIGMYLFITSGGGSPDTDRGIRIVNSDATSSFATTITLAEPIDGFVAATYGYNGSASNIDKWNFKIASLGTSGVVSNENIVSFKTDSNGTEQVWNYDKNEKIYRKANEIVNGSSIEDTTYVTPGNATIGTLSTNITKDGNIEVTYPLKIKNISTVPFGDTSATNVTNRYIDFNRASVNTLTASSIPIQPKYKMGVNASFDIDVESIVDFDSLFFGFDFKSEETPSTFARMEMFVTFDDYYGRGVKEASFKYPDDSGTKVLINDFNMLPNDFYRINVGGENSEGSIFAATIPPFGSIRAGCELDADIVDGIRDGSLSGRARFRMEIQYTPGATTDITLTMKQFGIHGIKLLDVTGTTNYTRVEGETLDDDSTPSNTAYKAFRRILESENYDNISSANIEYGNVSQQSLGRDNWYVGKQITEKKNSFEHLKELAEHSFVQIFQNRKGKIELSAWLDRTETPDEHNTSNIIKDSISNWKLTGIDKIYNNFNVRYSYNPGEDAYFSQHQIKDVDNPSGKANNENVMQFYWEVCRACYLIYNVVKEFKIDLSWFVDRERWHNADDPIKAGLGAQSSSRFFLDKAVFWLTRQKRDVTYSLAMDSANVLLELCERVNFKDPVYTNSKVDSTALSGHIYYIEYNIKKDEIKLSSLLMPNDTIDEEFGDIIETGSASDTITESGSQPDTITEDGV